MEFKHPKYYAALRAELRKLQAHPMWDNELQAPSLKHQAMKAPSCKPQAPSGKPQASSRKRQAL